MVQRDQAFSVRDIFNLDAPADLTTAGFSDAQNPHLPKRNEDYVFRRETMRDANILKQRIFRTTNR